MFLNCKSDDQSEVMKDVGKLEYTCFQCLSAPTLHNLKQHCSNTFHQRAMHYYINGGIMDLKQVRALELEQHGRDESDGPSNEEWLKLLDAIRAGLSGRQFVKRH